MTRTPRGFNAATVGGMLDSRVADHLDDRSRGVVIVALTDGRDTRHALQMGIQAARLLDTDLVIGAVAVEATGPVRASDAGDAELEPSGHQEFLHAQVRSLALGVPRDVHAEVDVRSAPTARLGISLLVARHRPALLVLGASHRGPMDLLLSTDPTLDLLRHTSCPVLVVPGEESRNSVAFPRTIGIAWDRSPEASVGLAAGLDLADRTGAAVRIIHVLEPEVPVFMPPSDPPLGRELETLRRAEAERALHHWLADRTLPQTLEIEYRDGSVRHELTAATAGLDLLVMAAKRVGPLRRVVAGSVSAHLVGHSRCPILVVPRGTTLPVPPALIHAGAQ